MFPPRYQIGTKSLFLYPFGNCTILSTVENLNMNLALFAQFLRYFNFQVEYVGEEIDKVSKNEIVNVNFGGKNIVSLVYSSLFFLYFSQFLAHE